MKRLLITYILAAFCAIAILSCNKEAAFDRSAPDTDTESTVLLTASIDASTKAVSIDESKVVCTWTVGDSVMLVRDVDTTIIAKLKVISVNGEKAQLSGKVKGSYPKDTPMSLYYGGTSYNYDYSGQTGTIESVVSRAYMKAETKIDYLDGKTLFLQSVTMQHQQSYIGLSFYRKDLPFKVKSVTIEEGGAKIIKKHRLDTAEVAYGTDEHFTVVSPSDDGQEVFYFALRDTDTNPHEYTLKITSTSDTTVFTGKLTASGLGGNYFADAKVALVRLSPVITAPTVYSYVYYDGNPHNLITPAVLQPGATALYGVSTAFDVVPTVWSEAIPMRTEEGSYTIWYKVNGGRDYENILPTMVGTTLIKPLDISISLPTPITNLVYNDADHILVNSDGVVKENGVQIADASSLQYFVSNNTTAPSNESAWSAKGVLPTGKAAGDYYIWCRYMDGVHPPVISTAYVHVIIKLPLTITAQEQSVSQNHAIKQYSDDHNVVSFSTSLLSGHTFTVTLTADTSAVGVFNEGITPSIVIKSGEIDVTNTYYTINIVKGRLNVY